MTDESPKQPSDVWPMPKFRFQVKWGTNVLLFQEVSGLDVESAPIEYQAWRKAATFSPIKMPGVSDPERHPEERRVQIG